MEVETLLRDIENKDLVLPEFQREYVWKEEDVRLLYMRRQQAMKEITYVKTESLGSGGDMYSNVPSPLGDYFRTPSSELERVTAALYDVQRRPVYGGKITYLPWISYQG